MDGGIFSDIYNVEEDVDGFQKNNTRLDKPVSVISSFKICYLEDKCLQGGGEWPFLTETIRMS